MTDDESEEGKGINKSIIEKEISDRKENIINLI